MHARAVRPSKHPRLSARAAAHSCVALLFALAGAGCAASRPAPPADPLGIAADVVPTGSVSAADAYPFAFSRLDDERARYRVVQGERAGAILVERRRREPSGAVVFTRTLEPASTPLDERTLLTAPDGSLILASLINHDRAVRVDMQPPPLAFPPELELNAPVRRATVMKLPRLDRPHVLREHGAGEMTLTYLGIQPLQVGAQTLDARLVREVFTSRLQNATAVRTIDRWFVPSLGLVAERYDEIVTAKFLNLVVERSAQSIRLEPPGDAPIAHKTQ